MVTANAKHDTTHGDKHGLTSTVLVLFVVATLLSTLFIVTHANHVHDNTGFDGSCSTCALLSASENVLKSSSAAVFAVALYLSGRLTGCLALLPLYWYRSLGTPVRLKVRMNN